MSYCRFSSEDYQCDVYVYESVGDYFALHVATNKIVFDEPLPEDIPCPGGDGPKFDAWYARYAKVGEMVDKATRVPIGLPHDGETFQLDDADSCADKLEELRALGYRVPQYAIDSLREEATYDRRDQEGK